MLQPDHPPLGGLYETDRPVAPDVRLFPAGVVRRHVLLAVLGEAEGGRADAGDAHGAVPAVDVHVVGDRAETVIGVEVAAQPGVPQPPPRPLVVRGVEHQAAQIVDIGTGAVQQIAEQARMRHPQHPHLVPAVAAVLQLHTVSAGALREVDQLPQLVQTQRKGAFHAHMLAVEHRGLRHLEVPVPRRGRVHEVDVAALAEVFEVLVTVGVDGGRRLSRGGDLLGGLGGLVLHRVAQGDDADARHREKEVDHGPAAVAESDDADANGAAPLERHPDHGSGLGVGRRGRGRGRSGCGCRGRRGCGRRGRPGRQAAEPESGARRTGGPQHRTAARTRLVVVAVAVVVVVLRGCLVHRSSRGAAVCRGIREPRSGPCRPTARGTRGPIGLLRRHSWTLCRNTGRPAATPEMPPPVPFASR